jgi:hypothetical protein
MGFEPTTPTLARLCSTPELRPHPRRGVAAAAAGLLCQMAPALATEDSRPADGRKEGQAIFAEWMAPQAGKTVVQ